MGRVDDDDVDPGFNERIDTVISVPPGTDGRADAQRSPVIFAGLRVILGLLKVFGSNHALKFEIVVHDEDFLDAVPVQQRLDLVVTGPLGHGNQAILRRHDLGHGRFHASLEAKVPARHDTDRLLVVDDGNAGYTQRMRQLDDFANGHVRGHRDRVTDDAALVFLDLGDFAGLLLDGHVLVDDADTPLLGQRDRQPGLGNGIHRRRQYRYVELDFPGQLRAQVDLVGEHRRVTWLQQNVVEGQGFLGNSHESGRILLLLG